MAQEKSYIVLGLGRFGFTVANQLADQGFNVIAIDKDMERVESISKNTQAVHGDFTNMETLRMVGADECDVGIVACGSALEDAVMGVLNLKEIGVPYIICKARDERCASVLKKIGADKVVQPEKELAIKTAKLVSVSSIIDYIDIDDEYSIVDIKCPKSWFGKTLKELDLRNRYGVNIIGFKLTSDAKMYCHIGPEYVIKNEEFMVAIIEKKKINEFDFIEH